MVRQWHHTVFPQIKATVFFFSFSFFLHFKLHLCARRSVVVTAVHSWHERPFICSFPVVPDLTQVTTIPSSFGWDRLSPCLSALIVTHVWVQLKLRSGYYFVRTLRCPPRLFLFHSNVGPPQFILKGGLYLRKYGIILLCFQSWWHGKLVHTERGQCLVDRDCAK